MGKAFVWRAAIVAALVNLALNPVVFWLEHQQLGFIPASKVARYAAVAAVLVAVLVCVVGARRVGREIRAGHRPRGGTAEEGRLLRLLPANPWLFGLALGAVVAVATTFVFGVLAVLGLTGLSYGAFVTFVALYSGGLAFVSMRWTILRQLMELAEVG